METDNIELIIAIAIGILAAIFTGAFVVLIVLCRRSKADYYKCGEINSNEIRPDVHLIENERPDMELGEVRLRPDIEELLAADDQWIDDATGLTPHCLAVLKTCHTLTERLTALAMEPLQTGKSGHEIIEIARQVSVRADDVVQSVYPPLDARLLEARAAALALAATRLALVARLVCSPSCSSSLSWIDFSLAEMDTHLLILREAAIAQEANVKMQNTMNILTNTHL